VVLQDDDVAVRYDAGCGLPADEIELLDVSRRVPRLRLRRYRGGARGADDRGDDGERRDGGTAHRPPADGTGFDHYTLPRGSRHPPNGRPAELDEQEPRKQATTAASPTTAHPAPAARVGRLLSCASVRGVPASRHAAQFR